MLGTVGKGETDALSMDEMKMVSVNDNQYRRGPRRRQNPTVLKVWHDLISKGIHPPGSPRDAEFIESFAELSHKGSTSPQRTHRVIFDPHALAAKYDPELQYYESSPDHSLHMAEATRLDMSASKRAGRSPTRRNSINSRTKNVFLDKSDSQRTEDSMSSIHISLQFEDNEQSISTMTKSVSRDGAPPGREHTDHSASSNPSSLQYEDDDQGIPARSKSIDSDRLMIFSEPTANSTSPSPSLLQYKDSDQDIHANTKSVSSDRVMYLEERIVDSSSKVQSALVRAKSVGSDRMMSAYDRNKDSTAKIQGILARRKSSSGGGMMHVDEPGVDSTIRKPSSLKYKDGDEHVMTRAKSRMMAVDDRVVYSASSKPSSLKYRASVQHVLTRAKSLVNDGMMSGGDRTADSVHSEPITKAYKAKARGILVRVKSGSRRRTQGDDSICDRSFKSTGTSASF